MSSGSVDLGGNGISGGGGGSGITSINGDSTAAQLIVSATTGTDISIGTAAGTTTVAIPSASATARGVVTTGAQTIAGAKTFSGAITASNLSGTNTGDVTIGTANGLSLASQALSLALSSTSTTGALSSADWNTFNSKQASGNYITALTGDVTAAGPGSAASTLATVNGNVGSFGSASSAAAFTVNAKGLLTAASSTAIQIAESQVTNLVSDLAAKQSATLTNTHILVGNGSNVATDVAAGGDLTLANTGAFTVAKIQGTSVTGTTGTGNVVLSAAPTLTGLLSGSSASFSSTIAASNFSGSSSGSNTGDQTITLTGDVTGSGTGSFAATIAAGAVTDAKGSLAVKPAIAVVATTNQALSALPTIDGVTLIDGSIALLSAQSSGSENGPWVVHVGAWTRPTWYPSGGTTQSFQFITTLVRLGTVYQGSVWRMTTAGAITIDTTATTWVVTPVSLNSNTVNAAVPVNIGGTGQTSYTDGQLLIGNSTGNTLAKATLTAGTGIAITNSSGSITIASNSTTASSTKTSNYNILSTDSTIFVDTSGAGFTLTLPSPAALAGKMYNIIDIKGTLSANNLTLAPNGAENIGGLAASFIFKTNWAWLRVTTNGTDWFID